jgi:hypothetical protein
MAGVTGVASAAAPAMPARRSRPPGPVVEAAGRHGRRGYASGRSPAIERGRILLQRGGDVPSSIFLIGRDNGLTELRQADYDSEELLQRLLTDPGLLGPASPGEGRGRRRHQDRRHCQLGPKVCRGL